MSNQEQTRSWPKDSLLRLFCEKNQRNCEKLRNEKDMWDNIFTIIISYLWYYRKLSIISLKLEKRVPGVWELFYDIFI